MCPLTPSEFKTVRKGCFLWTIPWIASKVVCLEWPNMLSAWQTYSPESWRSDCCITRWLCKPVSNFTSDKLNLKSQYRILIFISNAWFIKQELCLVYAMVKYVQTIRNEIYKHAILEKFEQLPVLLSLTTTYCFLYLYFTKVSIFIITTSSSFIWPSLAIKIKIEPENI